MVFTLGAGGVFALEDVLLPFLFVILGFVGLYKKIKILALLAGIGLVVGSFMFFSGVLMFLVLFLGLGFMVVGGRV